MEILEEVGGVESPNYEMIVVMANKINSLKGQLKLDPKFSPIAGEGKKGDGKSLKIPLVLRKSNLHFTIVIGHSILARKDLAKYCNLLI